MEDFVLIGGLQSLKESREQINNSLLTVRSLSSGTAFPTTNLTEGMLCYREDIGKVYQCTNAVSGLWTDRIRMDIEGNAASAATCTGNAATATEAGKCTGNAATATEATTAINVKTTANSTNAAYYLTFVAGADAQGIKYCSKVTVNPSTGILTATKVVNPVYSDYAEFFPRGEETEPGDIVALDMDSAKEQYVKACGDCIVAGVHSDEFAQIIGGNYPPEEEDYIEYNLPKFIPVSLAGRVHIKVIGAVKKGAYIIASDVPGIGITCDAPQNMRCVVGYALESSDDEGIKKVLVRIKGA